MNEMTEPGYIKTAVKVTEYRRMTFYSSHITV